MRHTSALAMSVFAVVCLQLAGCNKAPSYHKVEPFSLKKEDGINKVTFTEKAMERAAVKTEPMQEGKIAGAENTPPRAFVPYSALMYVPTGETFVYTSPKPRTFVRQLVKVDYIAKNELVILKEGPPKGTQIVTVGAAEIYGAEVGNGGGGGH